MDNEINENEEELNESGYTTFGGSAGRAGSFYTPTGPVGRFFAKFFANKAQYAAVKAMDQGKVHPLAGDTVVSTEVVKDDKIDDAPAMGGISRNPILPQLELNRRRRYKEYEEMDEYPEIGAAFDIYADDATQKGARAERWTIQSENQMVVDEVEALFDQTRMAKFLWDIIRNTVKYGDCFCELVLDVTKPQEGIKKIKILNPNWIIRVENEFGYLKKFLQEIPNLESLQYSEVGSNVGDRPVKYIELDKNQIVHYRLHTSDPVFYPYGKSIAALCMRVFRSLKMMEDAMMIYRLSRAPERRIFYVDTGNLPTSKAEMYIERLKQKFKKEKYYNTNNNTVDSRFNPMSMDEDFFVPSKNGRGTKIDTLPGATNLGEIEDVRYYRDKLLAALKVPKDYIVEKDSSPERKANLSQLDVKFARTVQRVQVDIETGLENMAKRHLQLRGFPASLIKKLKIRLPEPSDMSAKRKLDIDEQKTRVIQAVQQLQLFSKDEIYKEYYDMTPEEITLMKASMEEQRVQDMDQQQEQMEMEASVAGGEGAAGAPPTPGAPMAGPTPEEAGGQEGLENVPPTANEEKVSSLETLRDLVLEDDKKEVISRIIEKQQQKA
tara:strand:- start:3192 stop:5012 length:1821 start_codon:yes stop_codon:yes gene_type:complete